MPLLKLIPRLNFSTLLFSLGLTAHFRCSCRCRCGISKNYAGRCALCRHGLHENTQAEMAAELAAEIAAAALRKEAAHAASLR